MRISCYLALSFNPITTISYVILMQQNNFVRIGNWFVSFLPYFFIEMLLGTVELYFSYEYAQTFCVETQFFVVWKNS